MKGQAGVITWAIGIAVAVIMVGAVVLPILFTPVLPSVATFSNSTALADLNETADGAVKNQTFVLSLLSTERAGSIVVTHSGVNQSLGNVTVQIGATDLGLLTSSGSDTFAIGVASLSANTVVLYNVTANVTTVTQGDVTYYQLSESDQQGWNNAVVIFYEVLLALVIITALLLFIFKP